jgi:GTPase SAR1 family protein
MNIESWIKECKECTTKTVTLVLAGNKSDKEDQRQVTTQEAENFAKKYNLLFLEVCAKTGQNVEALFNLASYDVLNKIDNGDINLNEQVNIK